MLLNYSSFYIYNRSISFVQDEEYQFKLTRLLQKIKNFITQYPETSIKLYTSINDIYTKEVSNYQVTKSSSSSSQEPSIKNPLVIKIRGRPSKKRIKSSLEKEKNK